MNYKKIIIGSLWYHYCIIMVSVLYNYGISIISLFNTKSRFLNNKFYKNDYIKKVIIGSL